MTNTSIRWFISGHKEVTVRLRHGYGTGVSTGAVVNTNEI